MLESFVKNRRWSPTVVLATVALLMVAGTVAADTGRMGAVKTAHSGLDDETHQWRFRVLLDEREIGFHTFRVSAAGRRSQVNIDAEFNVRILFFNAYSYSHQNQEIWQDGCLLGLESITDDNGELQRVDGEAFNGEFIINTRKETRSAADSCVRSFAYWNPEFLDSNRLLNSQTGELIDVLVSRRADEVIDIEGEAVAALRYTLEMEDGTISLWYSRDSHQWLALEAPAPGGRVLRYEPVELPFDLPATSTLALR
jgi:hypothetical protein